VNRSAAPGAPADKTSDWAWGGEPAGSVGYDLRPAGPDDVEAYVHCHVDCLAETYADIMPPAFAEQQRAAVPQRIADTRRAWSGSGAPGTTAPGSAAPGTGTRAWVASDHGGTVVGVARSGPGPQTWETSMSAPRAAVDFELHHIYTRRRTHGSGLGQALLDLAVGDRDAYLWILCGNPRAERFYRRNGFLPDGVEMSCGPTWFERPMFRMLRHGGARA
jgi:GNAT superfamily N-acetyltransferase